MSEKPDFDPFAPWMQFTDKWMKAWSDVMSETVASESFATSMGQQLEGFLEASKLVQQQMKISMDQFLQQMNLPTRTQMMDLAERLTSIEMRLDDLDAKLDEGLDRLKIIAEALTPDQ